MYNTQDLPKDLELQVMVTHWSDSSYTVSILKGEEGATEAPPYGFNAGEYTDYFTARDVRKRIAKELKAEGFKIVTLRYLEL